MVFEDCRTLVAGGILNRGQALSTQKQTFSGEMKVRVGFRLLTTWCRFFVPAYATFFLPATRHCPL